MWNALYNKLYFHNVRKKQFWILLNHEMPTFITVELRDVNAWTDFIASYVKIYCYGNIWRIENTRLIEIKKVFI